MAQLRQDYARFVERDAEILVVGPEDADAFARYWAKEELPFVGLPDPAHRVAELYRQEVNWLKAGRMPALFVVDKAGQLHLAHYARLQFDIPKNDDVLALLDTLNDAKEPSTRAVARS